MGVGAEQVIGGVAVLPRVEDRLAVQDPHQCPQLAAVTGGPNRSVAQCQEAGVAGSHQEGDGKQRPGELPHHSSGAARPAPAPRLELGRADGPAQPDSSGLTMTSIASGATIISAFAAE